MTNWTPGQVVSTSSSCWREMLREEKASQEITIHLQGSGSKSPLSRLPLHSHQGRGQDTLGYVFSAGRAPGHRAPTNPVTTAPPWTQDRQYAAPQWRLKSMGPKVLVLPHNVWVTLDKLFPMAKIPHLTNCDNSASLIVLLWWLKQTSGHRGWHCEGTINASCRLFSQSVNKQLPCTSSVWGLQRWGHGKMGINYDFSVSRKSWQLLSPIILDFPAGPVNKNLLDNARTPVWSLVCKDSTCCRATKPMYHNYWAHATRACAQQQKKPPQQEALTLQLESSPHSPQLEKSSCSNKDPVKPKIK